MASTPLAGLTANMQSGSTALATAAAVRAANSGLTITPKVNFSFHFQGTLVNFREAEVAVVTSAELTALNALANHTSLFATP